MPEAKFPRVPEATAPRQPAAARKVLAEVPANGGGPAGVTRERAA